MSLWNNWATYVYSLHPEMHVVHWEAKLNLRSIIIYVGQINPYLDVITEDLNTAYLSIKSSPRSFKRVFHVFVKVINIFLWKCESFFNISLISNYWWNRFFSFWAMRIKCSVFNNPHISDFYIVIFLCSRVSKFDSSEIYSYKISSQLRFILENHFNYPRLYWSFFLSMFCVF